MAATDSTASAPPVPPYDARRCAGADGEERDGEEKEVEDEPVGDSWVGCAEVPRASDRGYTKRYVI